MHGTCLLPMTKDFLPFHLLTCTDMLCLRIGITFLLRLSSCSNFAFSISTYTQAGGNETIWTLPPMCSISALRSNVTPTAHPSFPFTIPRAVQQLLLIMIGIPFVYGNMPEPGKSLDLSQIPSSSLLLTSGCCLSSAINKYTGSFTFMANPRIPIKFSWCLIAFEHMIIFGDPGPNSRMLVILLVYGKRFGAKLS